MECHERVGRLACPKCGGERIRYVATVEVWRNVLRIEDGWVLVDGNYETIDDTERAAHVECLAEACGHRWPLPEWVRDRIAEALCGKLGPVVLDAETSHEIAAGVHAPPVAGD